ncbi:hypothetical protein DM01DRAFT_1334550 [Hesseltinella vesiculosa]|uniref:Mid2 domain-containing protein n=1 Tax=Hesseltinella vesiculosa TaxID=101127 RepID=A0A1X2GMG6_9FUNG|nr:hypothetical protein DM01DRAFT_1334550 [Hesseltinella vesiculosa]
MKLTLSTLLVCMSWLLLARPAEACFLGIFCESSTSSAVATPTESHHPPASSGVSSQPVTHASSSAPSSSLVHPNSTAVSSIRPTSSAQLSSLSSSLSSLSSSDLSSSDTSSSSAPSASSSSDAGAPVNNTAVIAGSVCGFVAVLALGFGYAFLSKSRRNKRKKAMYDDDFNNLDFNANNTRASPAMAAAAAQAADGLHPNYQHGQWNDYNNGGSYGYNSPTSASSGYYPQATGTHSPVVNPNMAYPDQAISGAYYSPAPAAYYDGYNSSPMQYPPPAHQDAQHYEIYANVPAPSTAGTYSAPNAYDDHDPHVTPAAQHHSPPVSHYP